MTFVLAPLEFSRGTETIKTIVEHLHQSLGAGFQPLPKHGASRNDGDGKSNVSLDGQVGNIRESQGGQHAAPHAGR